jgi:excisionase family DNA binding protein
VGADLESILDLLAEKVAEKVRIKMTQPGQSAGAPVQRRLFSVADAAKYIGRTEDAVRHMIDSGKLPVVRIDTRISLDKEDLDELIRYSKQNSS